jgi:hypothetical protein
VRDMMLQLNQIGGRGIKPHAPGAGGQEMTG